MEIFHYVNMRKKSNGSVIEKQGTLSMQRETHKSEVTLWIPKFVVSLCISRF